MARTISRGSRAVPVLIATLLVAAPLACGDDSDGDGGGGGHSDADRRGVGSQCDADEDCTEEEQRCLTQFRGGYCGVQGCAADADCPDGSACVLHDDAQNYCFLICAEKPECNTHRELDFEANCSSSITWVEAPTGPQKACVPPSSGA